jgi:hypothetical protein
MTAPGPPPALFDTANLLLSQTVCRLDAGTMTIPDGTKVAILTIRTPSSTTTVFLVKEDLGVWSDIIANLNDEMTGSRLHVPSAAETSAVAKANGSPPQR